MYTIPERGIMAVIHSSFNPGFPIHVLKLESSRALWKAVWIKYGKSDSAVIRFPVKNITVFFKEKVLL